MCCGVGRGCGSDPALLWCRPAAAAPIRPLAWELPHAVGLALKKKKKKKKENRATDKDQGKCKLMFFRAGVWWPWGLVLVVLLFFGMKNTS